VRKTTESFHHIIDKDTLMPAEGLLSVSIICSDSGMGDGLSTALFCMSIEDGMALIESLDGVEALWVDENETKHYSSGFNKYFYEK
jgi:thiamine biosynthesis lipoprotein